MNRRAIIEQYCEDEAIFADGFDDAILGTDALTGKVVYSYSKGREILVRSTGMSYEEADEYLDFNVLGAYVGPMTPLWVYDEAFYYG